jgi:nucleotide-binding universal stress UspA family protein
MKPIVLATDGSPSAAEATLNAVELARALGAPLVAVAVEHVVVPGYGYYGYGDLIAELTKIETEHVDETLAHVKAVAGEAGIRCDTVPCKGAVAEEICRVARRRDARLIVIGAHGWSLVSRMLHGSVSTAVLHEAHCPVLVVRGGPEVFAREELSTSEIFI